MKAEAADDELIGTVLGGRYKIVRKLGHGGMGAVYEAIQEGLNRHVAVKVLHPYLKGESVLVRRFEREAHAAAALGHPHIVQVTDFRHDKGEPPFLVMEYLAGESLRVLLQREGKLPAARIARIVTQMLSALGAAHRAQIVHRDIKPDNVFIASSSAVTDLVKVLDFGVVKLLGERGDTGPITVAGAVLGTLSYMAPEQARGRGVDGRTDLYAVAACMYVACSGRRPIEAPDMGSLLGAILTEDAKPLASVCPDVDPDFAAIVDRGLKKDPNDRFASAEAMEQAIAAWLSRPRTGDVAASAGPASSPRSASPAGPDPPSHREPPPAIAHANGPAHAVAIPVTKPRPPPPGPTLPVGPSPAAWLPLPPPSRSPKRATARSSMTLWIVVGVGAVATLGLAAVGESYLGPNIEEPTPAAVVTHAAEPVHVEPTATAPPPAPHAGATHTAPAHDAAPPHHPPPHAR